MTFPQKILFKDVRKCGQYKAIEINFLKNAGTNAKTAKGYNIVLGFIVRLSLLFNARNFNIYAYSDDYMF